MQLHFHSVGGGPPLLLLHGMLGSHQNLLPIAEMLRANFRVFIPDLRNHGASPHDPELNYEVLASDLSEFIAAHQLGTVHILGHSMGGKAAMRLAQIAPELLAKLIIVDMSPRAQPPRYHYLLDALRDLDPSQYQQRSEVDAALAAGIPDKGIRQFLLKNLGRDQSGRMFWKPNLPAIHANYERLRGGIAPEVSFDGETLFIRGARSDYIHDDDLPLILQIFPRARVEKIPNAGHWVHAESFEPFMRVVTDFLTA